MDKLFSKTKTIHYSLCSLFLTFFIVHVINMHILKVISTSITLFFLLVIAIIYAALGGILQLSNNERKRKQYLIGVFVSLILALIALFYSSKIVIIISLLGFLLGFYDFRLAVAKK